MNSLEEANNLIVLHIRTIDLDIVVILMGFFMQFLQYNKTIELSVDFGVSDSRRLININNCFKHVEKEKL